MAGNNPVALPLLLTVTSLVVAGYSWDSTEESLPLWWSVYAHPILWVPRWFGLLIFPVLQLVIPYVMYQVACRDEKLDGQSGESAYAVANIIALPSVLLFVEYLLVYLQAALSDSHDFLFRIFTSNIAVWALIWLGYNLQYVEPNSSIGVPVFFPLSEKELWTRTHERAGMVLMVFGVILFIFGLACPVGIAYFVVTLVIWLGAYVLAVVDSYMLSRIEGATPALLESESFRQPLVSEP